MPTLKQIAAELGVSHTAVSVVAGARKGTARVSEEKRKLIQARLDDVGFRPNRLAIALKGGRKGYVSLFLHKHGTYGSEINEAFISTISETLSQRGLGLWLRIFASDREFFDACSQRLLREVDGLVVAGIVHPDLLGNLELLQSKGLPVVCAFADWKDNLQMPTVFVDAERQGYLAGRHLIDVGCTRIARFYRHERRQQGFMRALEEAGISPTKALMIPASDFGYANGLHCMSELIKTGEPFDAISADSDALASAAIHFVLRSSHSLRVWPKVVGTDDSPIAKHCAVPLTSISSEIEERARIAAGLLFDLFDGKEVKSSVIVRPKLVVRESSGPWQPEIGD